MAMTDNTPLAGRVAILTGAGRGIGRYVALSLARNGARVVLAARTESQLRAVREEIEILGGMALDVVTDITSESDVITLLRKSVEQFGRLDIVINNAGIGVFGPLAEATTEQWDRIMAVN